jgi:hypothetical protein
MPIDLGELRETLDALRLQHAPDVSPALIEAILEAEAENLDNRAAASRAVKVAVERAAGSA